MIAPEWWWGEAGQRGARRCLDERGQGLLRVEGELGGGQGQSGG
ncbi:hypothetical protein [Streptomyces griseus]